ncbi:MAG: PIG-L deacetylase family protein [Planctomycetota bacterium]|jgi:LmbE family N-acetylglucosaminyl deacetylase
MTKVLVIAPHPDDEVLGAGGTMLRHVADGDDVHVVICTRGEATRFGKEQVEQVQAEARRAHQFLGLAGSHFLDLPAARLDTVPGSDINAALGEVMAGVNADIVYAPHPGDVHLDHQLIFQALMVCARPVGKTYPQRILAYETVSETDWYAPPLTPPFIPNVFIDITEFIDRKLDACAVYESQIRPSPDQRSVESLRALAATRGHAMNMHYAEAFTLIREVIRR